MKMYAGEAFHYSICTYGVKVESKKYSLQFKEMEDKLEKLP